MARGARQHERFPERLLEAATDRTHQAIGALLSLPAECGAQAATKLASVVSHFDLTGCGIRAGHLGLLVSDCVRFLVASDLRVPA